MPDDRTGARGRRRAFVGWLAISIAVGACSHAASPAPRPTRHLADQSTPTLDRERSAERAPTAKVDADQCGALELKLPPLIEAGLDVPVPEIEDLSGEEQMAPFYEKLARVARHRGGEHVRIALYGDSNMTRDHISGELRRTLQLELGDGGHGYIAVGKPWSWYLHTDVRHGVDPKGWKVFSMSTDQVADHLYGFAGLATQNVIEKARAWVATAEGDSPVGKGVSHVEVLFLRRPNHGTFTLSIDGKEMARVDTSGPKVAADRVSVDVPDGPHRIDVVSQKDIVRLLGLVLERAEPGVVVDSLGIGGVNVELLVRGDRQLTIDSLRLRKPDLVMLLTGATEPDSPGHVAATKELVARHREALPGVPFLIMSPPDLAGGTLKNPTRSVRINQIHRQKREAAEQAKTVFWDFRKAMGGELSIVHFAERQMAWNDFIHLTEPGGRFMGRRLGFALIRDFNRYLTAHPDAGCKPR